MCDHHCCYANSLSPVGLVVAVPLVVVYVAWLRLPREFRRQRPLVLRAAMGILSMGTFALAIPMNTGPNLDDLDRMLWVGVKCAGALGVLMVLELIAYVRRPSSFPRARVTHGA